MTRTMLAVATLLLLWCGQSMAQTAGATAATSAAQDVDAGKKAKKVAKPKVDKKHSMTGQPR